MSDIVERLLSYADDAADPLVPGDDNIIIQAADEIERLQASVERCKQSLEKWDIFAGDIIDDRNRLQEALQLVMAYRRGEGRFQFDQMDQDQRDNALMDAWQEVEETICAALRETTVADIVEELRDPSPR